MRGYRIHTYKVYKQNIYSSTKYKQDKHNTTKQMTSLRRPKDEKVNKLWRKKQRRKERTSWSHVISTNYRMQNVLMWRLLPKSLIKYIQEKTNSKAEKFSSMMKFFHLSLSPHNTVKKTANYKEASITDHIYYCKKSGTMNPAIFLTK